MLRTNRVTAALVRQLLLRSLPTVALAATVSIAAVGCEDESKPEYSVKRLEDVTTAPRAIQKLFNFYTDGETKAEGKAPESDDVKSFLALKEMSIEALTNCYVNLFNDLNEADRVKLINLISIARDPRTEPALKKALEEFAKDGTRSDDLKFAMRAASELKLAGVASAVVPAFKKIRASSPQGGSVYRDMNDTMLKWADKSWGP